MVNKDEKTKTYCILCSFGSIAQSVLKLRAENDNVFIPLNISVDRPITFTIDNIDFKIHLMKTSAA